MSTDSLVDVSQQRPETQNQVIHEIDELMQSWEHRIRFGNLRLAERFLNFELNVLLHLRFKSGKEGILGFHKVRPIEPIGSVEKIVTQGKEGAVFVDVVKLTDSPESVVPTRVWFESVDSLKGLKEHSLYFGSLSGFVASYEKIAEREHIGAITFDTPANVNALQAADMVAWANGRKASGRLFDNGFEPLELLTRYVESDVKPGVHWHKKVDDQSAKDLAAIVGYPVRGSSPRIPLLQPLPYKIPVVSGATEE